MLNKHVHLNGEIGVVVEVSLLRKSVTIQTLDDNIFSGDLDEAVELTPIAKLDNGEYLYEGDIFEENKKLYKLVVVDFSSSSEEVGDADCVFVQIDKQFEVMGQQGRPRTFLASEFAKDFINAVKKGENVKRLGNIAYTEPKPLFDFSFNMKIVKRVVEGRKPVYLYAGNRKHDYEIDLIKVIFAGANIFPNETYERKTFTYDEFEYKMTHGVLQEASAYELERVAREKMYGGNQDDDEEVEWDALTDEDLYEKDYKDYL